MTTYTVTTNADSGAGSLRAALAEAQNGDTVNFASGVTDIVLSSTLTISKNVTIEGAQSGGPDVVIDGSGGAHNFADFTVTSSATAAVLNDLVIQNGRGV